jgi:flagellar assembly protein FliH
MTEECKPWRAPDLDMKGNDNDNDNYDFNLSGLESIAHREQQQIIRQQSYEKSYAKGYMEGLEQGQKEIREQVGRLQAVMTTLAKPLIELDSRVVDELVQLSMAAVKQMVRRELKISPGEVVAVLKEALNLLPVTKGDVTLELHPEDAHLIRESLMNPVANPGWKIVEDPLLTRGGCRVLTKTTRIDATVENRINAVIAEVMGGERKVDSSL